METTIPQMKIVFDPLAGPDSPQKLNNDTFDSLLAKAKRYLTSEGGSVVLFSRVGRLIAEIGTSDAIPTAKLNVGAPLVARFFAHLWIHYSKKQEVITAPLVLNSSAVKTIRMTVGKEILRGDFLTLPVDWSSARYNKDMAEMINAINKGPVIISKGFPDLNIFDRMENITQIILNIKSVSTRNLAVKAIKSSRVVHKVRVDGKKVAWSLRKESKDNPASLSALARAALPKGDLKTHRSLAKIYF